MEVVITNVDLSMYDGLLGDKGGQPADVHESLKDFPSGPPFAGDKGRVRIGGTTGSSRVPQLRALLVDLTERARGPRSNRVERLLRESRLSMEKSLSIPDLKRVLARNRFGLLEGKFVDRYENVLVFGNPGSGKTQHRLSARPGIDPGRKEGDIHDLRSDGSGPAGREA